MPGATVVVAAKQASGSGMARAGTPVSGSVKGPWPDGAGPGCTGAGRLPGCVRAGSAAVASAWPGSGQLRSRCGAREEGQEFADDGRVRGWRFGQREVRLDLVAVAAAVFVLDHVAGCGQVGDDALRSVMSRLAAMSRSRAPGSRATHSSTRAWLVRKLQLVTRRTYSYFQKSIASFQLPM